MRQFLCAHRTYGKRDTGIKKRPPVVLALAVAGAFGVVICFPASSAARLVAAASKTTDGVVSPTGYGHLIPISRLRQRPAPAQLSPTVVPQFADAPAGSAFQPERPAAQSPSSGTPPTLHQSFQGIFDPGITPPDTNGAAGPTRQVEIVNQKVGIWDRSSPPTLLAQANLQALTGSTGSALYDPRMLWDPQTQRFYYSVLDDTNNALLTGFSKTAHPSSAAAWCKYAIPTPNLIDQPHLGDSQYFVLAGFFLFYSGPQVAWYAKPPAGSTCPTSLKSGTKAIPSSGGLPPAPAHEIDVRATGYVVTADLSNLNGLTMIRVTRNSSGSAVFSPPSPISVSTFANPPPAPQAGASQRIDLVDARLGEVVAAVDPSRGKLALWAAHTVAGGAGSAVRWYEIDPSTNGLFQSGTVQSSTLWNYFGTISPDRLVNGSTHKFGDSMVLTFNTSSPSHHISIRVVSKVGSAPQSAPVLVKNSPATYLSYDCPMPSDTCRWGDYSGAAPDPKASPSGAHGVVWGANEWNVANPNPTGATSWRTWVFTASP
jgi:hypothetical protein